MKVIYILLSFLVFSAFFFFNSLTVVDAGTRGVLKQFGQIVGVLEEGLHLRLPFISSVTVVDVKTQRYQADASAASRDLQIISTQIVLNYRVNPSAVADLVREIGLEYEARIIDPAVQESLKAATAQFTAEELITRRPEVSDAIRRILELRLAPRSIIVESVSITDFDFSEEFSRAIEAKQVAEQDALRAQNELRRAQIEAQQQVARAEAEAKARLEVARAEAEALRLQREVISENLLMLRFIERWNGVLPRVMAADGSNGIFSLIPLTGEDVSDAQPMPARPTPSPTPPPVSTPEP